nr:MULTISPECIES: hypothetical protein [unclassified Caulobacter]
MREGFWRRPLYISRRDDRRADQVTQGRRFASPRAAAGGGVGGLT